MSRPAHDGVALIPRPEQSPVDGRTKAMAEAVATGSVQPIRAFVAHWAAVVEIERYPATADSYHRANYLANHATTVAECRAHAVTVAEIYRTAFAAVNG